MTQGKQISVHDAFQHGMARYQNGQLKPAVQLFSDIVCAAPKFAPAHQMLGLIAFQTGQMEPAVNAMTEAVRLQPENVSFLTNFTEILRSAGHLDHALEIGTRAVRLAPGNAAAHSNLGLVHYDQDNLAAAQTSQERALALDPEFDRAINNLGSIARDNGDRSEAAALYRKALKIKPDSSETVNNLISVLIEDENVAEARAVAESQLERSPRDAELHRNFGRVFMLENNLDKAENAFRNAISLNGEKAESYVGLSQVLYEKNHPKLALIEAEQALRLDPENAAACHQIGIAKAHLGDVEAAIGSYQKALELKSDMSSSRLALGHLEIERGNFDAARAHFENAAATSEDKLSATIALAKLEEISPDSLVFRALEAALPDAPTMLPQKAAAYYYALGECYEKLKRHEEAFSQFEAGARIKRSLIDYDPAENDRLTDELIATFDQAMIERLRECAVSSDRPIFVLGMPRSGTTLTESILNAHPKVFGAGELNDLQNIFGRLADGTTNVPQEVKSVTDDKLAQRAERYVEALAQHAPDMPHVVDKMPANFQLVGLIHSIMPNAKIVHVTRNPFDTCLSCYTRLFERSQYHSYDLVELGRYYNNYARLMNHWRSILPDGAFHEVKYEALIDDFDAEARCLIDYCSLEWDDACLEFHKSKRRVRTASVQQVRKPLYASSKEKWRTYEAQLSPLIDLFGANIE
ncbi:tetratricopeptide repeat-containing sulfotransferase family protein [Ruegeria halocynthiae]|uniref:tetratricopeptide repeat-containing sulfotransferase family protein n=1 Tax=Ruegeria halocynthiae TaxID=985054 RepID=UPI00055CC4FE|nr:tetratricopeptide repeat-containing sulfotransferase family protein [Ruegeria halocynthiae]